MTPDTTPSADTDPTETQTSKMILAGVIATVFMVLTAVSIVMYTEGKFDLVEEKFSEDSIDQSQTCDF